MGVVGDGHGHGRQWHSASKEGVGEGGGGRGLHKGAWGRTLNQDDQARLGGHCQPTRGLPLARVDLRSCYQGRQRCTQYGKPSTKCNLPAA